MRLPDFRRPYTTQAELEQNDHREDAAHFSITKSQTIKVKQTAFKRSFQFQRIRRQVYD